MSGFMRIIAWSFGILGLLLMLDIATQFIPRWTVEPRANWKWSACYSDRNGKGCGSPMTFDEAKWWSETKGGKKFYGSDNVDDGPCIPGTTLKAHHSCSVKVF